jgi:hypothetical protein
MRHLRFLSLLFGTSLLFSTVSQAQQLWSGIVSPTRAINWSNAGFPGSALPDSSWTQCGATIAAYGSSGAPASPATINNAIAACGVNQYVQLAAGTFYLNSGIGFDNKSNVVLRGMGANQTLIAVYSTGCPTGPGGSACETIAMEGSVNGSGYENNVCDFTAGYTQGSTSITLNNCGSTTPAVGGGSNLKVGTFLILDQLDETSDTGTIWNCETTPNCTWNGPGGFQRDDGTCNGSTCYRSQEQGVIVTGVSGSGAGPYTVTISSPLYMPNWRSGQLPQAWFANTVVTKEGLENLSIDGTNIATGGSQIVISNATYSWVSGVRSIDAGRSHIDLEYTAHDVVNNSYFYQNKTGGSVSYGVELAGGWDTIVENNIFQQVTDSDPSNNGGAEGNVLDYNFDLDNVFNSPGWFQSGFYQHAGGDAFNLWEGNIGAGYTSDNIHGTHHFETLYRNTLFGWIPSCAGSPCTAQTVPIQLYAGSRYMNIIGNILGTAGFHTNYQCNATSDANCSAGSTSIYTMGYTWNGGSVCVVGACGVAVEQWCTSSACTSFDNYDPLVNTYMMRWGNYDTVTGATRWCGNSSDTGWSTKCGGASEVPTGLALYSNSVPTYGDTGSGQSTMPPSFFYSAKPSWWPSGKVWPAIGPDVSSGNLLICSGGTYAGSHAVSGTQCTGGSGVSGLAGLVNSNPAMDCALNVMGMPPDGSGSVLSFNAATCYGLTKTQSPSPAPPPALTATPVVVQ